MKPTLQGMDEKGVNFGVVMQPQPVNIYFFLFLFILFFYFKDTLSVARMHPFYIQN